MAIGDDAQSIYGFRGANYQNILDFSTEFNAKEYMITTNYRSTPQILDLANNVISHNEFQRQKEMKPDPNRADGPLPKLVSADKDKTQMDYIIERIVNLHNNDEIPYNEMAVMFRSMRSDPFSIPINYLSRQLVKLGIPHKVTGGESFFDKEHIEIILHLLEYRRNPFGTDSKKNLEKILPFIADGIKESTAYYVHKSVSKQPDPIETMASLKMFRRVYNNPKFQSWMDKKIYPPFNEFFSAVKNMKGETFGNRLQSFFSSDYIKQRIKELFKTNPKNFESVLNDYKIFFFF